MDARCRWLGSTRPQEIRQDGGRNTSRLAHDPATLVRGLGFGVVLGGELEDCHRGQLVWGQVAIVFFRAMLHVARARGCSEHFVGSFDDTPTIVYERPPPEAS